MKNDDEVGRWRPARRRTLNGKATCNNLTSRCLTLLHTPSFYTNEHMALQNKSEIVMLAQTRPGHAKHTSNMQRKLTTYVLREFKSYCNLVNGRLFDAMICPFASCATTQYSIQLSISKLIQKVDCTNQSITHNYFNLSHSGYQVYSTTCTAMLLGQLVYFDTAG